MTNTTKRTGKSAHQVVDPVEEIKIASSYEQTMKIVMEKPYVGLASSYEETMNLLLVIEYSETKELLLLEGPMQIEVVIGSDYNTKQ